MRHQGVKNDRLANCARNAPNAPPYPSQFKTPTTATKAVNRNRPIIARFLKPNRPIQGAWNRQVCVKSRESIVKSTIWIAGWKWLINGPNGPSSMLKLARKTGKARAARYIYAQTESSGIVR